jgi:hypothetical protein
MNKIVEKIKAECTVSVDYMEGNIIDISKDSCKLSSRSGAVYGFAVKIMDEEEKQEIFDELNCKDMVIDDWVSIGDDLYPLYWGKEQNLGSRVFTHTRSPRSTGSIQLNKDKYGVLVGKEVLYGSVLCDINYSVFENSIRSKYPDILKTKSEK